MFIVNACLVEHGNGEPHTSLGFGLRRRLRVITGLRFTLTQTQMMKSGLLVVCLALAAFTGVTRHWQTEKLLLTRAVRL